MKFTQTLTLATAVLRHAEFVIGDVGTPSLVLQHHESTESQTFEHAWRSEALQFAKKLQPHMPVSNRMSLTKSLNTVDPSPPEGRVDDDITTFMSPIALEADASFYVAATGDTTCSDGGNSGMTTKAPFCSLQRGIEACRNAAGDFCDVLLLSGTHRLNETITITAQDSGVTITRADQLGPQNAVVVSGAVAVGGKDKWIKDYVIKGAGINGTDLTVWSTSYALPRGEQVDTLLVNGRRAIRARYPNADPEVDKYPNGFIMTSPHVKWLPPKDLGDPNYIQYNSSDYYRSTYRSLFQDYRGGTGGQCSHYTPPFSYWCSEQPQGGGASQFVLPSGIKLDNFSQVLPNAPYKTLQGGILAAWRPGHWANWAFEVDEFKPSTDPDSASFTFGIGGFQGGRGNQKGAEWYVENFREELDFPREFYHDPVDSKLYFVSGTAAVSWNSSQTRSAAEPELLNFEHSKLKILFHVAGTQAAPVRDFTIAGITLTGSALTFMDPHGVPSGGDWALQRTAAVFVEGAESFALTNSNLTHLDGNAIMVSGYSRNASIVNNTFLSTGSSAIALWGLTNGTDPIQPEGTGPDGTEGNFPRFTTVAGNFITHLGIHEKQSSCFFQAKSAQSFVYNNLCFDVPRAGFNINDGFGGGTIIHHNLLFQTCGESGDHGAINTWNVINSIITLPTNMQDRQSYVTTIRTNEPSVIPAVNEIHHNFIVADFDANGGMVDNDDGSSFYNIHSNFGIYGGAKMGNFDGHNKVCHNNVYARPTVYGPTCFWNWPGWFAIQGSEETFENNTCFLADSENYISMPSQCDFSNVSSIGVHVGGNAVYSPNGAGGSNTTFVKGCQGTITAYDWLSKVGSFDSGTKLFDLPSVDDIMKAGMNVLEN